ncbi:MAG: MBL fold metallo-hydrolase [Patescibacteria group bacterium]
MYDKRTWALYGLVASGIVAAGIVYIVSTHGRTTAPELAVHFLDVGQGDAILIQLPDGPQVLIDAGADNSVLFGLGENLPWWDRTIEYAVVTHPDLDHFGGFFGVVEKYSVGRFLYNNDGGKGLFKMLHESIEARKIASAIIGQGYVLEWPSGVTLRFLWPQAGYESEDTNARSLTALLTWHDAAMLLTGDLPVAEEQMLVQAYPDLHAQVLKVGHHGSKGSSGAVFLETVRPELCIISAGKDNSFGHPHPETLSRLEAVGCEVLSTVDVGTVTVRSDGSGHFHE